MPKMKTFKAIFGFIFLCYMCYLSPHYLGAFVGSGGTDALALSWFTLTCVVMSNTQGFFKKEDRDFEDKKKA